MLSDSDNDGVQDLMSRSFKTDPFKADSDGMAFRDGENQRSVLDAQYGYCFTHLPFAREPTWMSAAELDIDRMAGLPAARGHQP